MPNLCYIPRSELAKIDSGANVQKGVIPALVAGMLSPSTCNTDLVVKVEIYREAGVAEYWAFDLDKETVWVYRFGEDPQRPVAGKSFDDTLTTPLLPGFSLEMPRIREALGVGGKSDRRRGKKE